MKEWIDKIRGGDPRAVARALTEVENRTAKGHTLLGALHAHTGRAWRVGITGAPGAGKSSLVDRLAAELRQQNQTVGIIAVDPTSAYSGGAILGDRIRMQAHAGDAGIFIRSMATRGFLGGLARTTGDIAMVLDAAGRDVILIETVGVGQDEVEVVKLADVVAVVLVPGMGDEVQALKAGILEIADVLVINKADRDGADRLEQELRGMLEMAHRPDGWRPPIVRTVATEGQGVTELLAALRSFHVAERGALLRTAEAQAGRLDHLGIAVKSLDEAERFYRETLGLAVLGREEVPHEKVRVAMLPVGEARIELLEATAPDSPIARFIAKRGEGLHHVALRVPDLEAVVERLRAEGVRLAGEKIREGAGGHRYVFVHPSSTGGVLLELVETKDTA